MLKYKTKSVVNPLMKFKLFKFYTTKNQEFINKVRLRASFVGNLHTQIIPIMA